MPKQAPLTDPQGEVRELKTADLQQFKRAAALSPSLQSKLRARGPQKAPTKERVTIRLSRSVVDSFRSTGDGWQTRVDSALQDWLKKHKLPA
jgi:uncharacterized protein (DUF4415 family)